MACSWDIIIDNVQQARVLVRACTGVHAYAAAQTYVSADASRASHVHMQAPANNCKKLRMLYTAQTRAGLG